MSSSSAGLPTPEGPGSVSAPHLPAGFTGTFTSRYIDAGDVRLHAVIGGDGPPLLLIHGWPGSWYYWRLVMPALAVFHRDRGPAHRSAGRPRRHRRNPARPDPAAQGHDQSGTWSWPVSTIIR